MKGFFTLPNLYHSFIRFTKYLHLWTNLLSKIANHLALREAVKKEKITCEEGGGGQGNFHSFFNA